GSPQPGGSSTFMPGRNRSTAWLAEVQTHARGIASLYTPFGRSARTIKCHNDPAPTVPRARAARRPRRLLRSLVVRVASVPQQSVTTGAVFERPQRGRHPAAVL